MRTSLAVLILLGLTVNGLKISSKSNLLTQGKARAQASETHSCNFSIDRVKKGAADYKGIIGGGSSYQDPDFGPEASSIFWEDRNRGYLYGHVSDISWDRAKNIVADAVTFGAKIEPWDIFQGAIGDCYFLAAGSAIAEHDDRIKGVFVPEVYSYPEEGIYAFNVYVKGIPTTVSVDDYLPYI